MCLIPMAIMINTFVSNDIGFEQIKGMGRETPLLCCSSLLKIPNMSDRGIERFCISIMILTMLVYTFVNVSP